MSERKVINKYFPPDFDPANIPKRKITKDLIHTVRLMTPFSMRCNTCGEYIYKRKKFNARKEKVDNENYLGISIFRFYIKCPVCSATISFKTDPKNTDYVAEEGAERNFEPWRDDQFLAEELKREMELEENSNPMKALENRTLESKREMDILDGLDEIRTKNSALERTSDAQEILLNKLLKKKEQLAKLEEEEDAYIKNLFYSEDGGFVRRLPDEIDAHALIKEKVIESKELTSTSLSTKRKAAETLGIRRKKNPAVIKNEETETLAVDKKKVNIIPSSISILGNTYSSSDSE
ncbi:hypothetical protein HK099_002588 [Clydaea vesicula]|uniref:Splicing factor YJU2 n=1 Tax=Clydaea vesicula TaxID=447962 RepID=A0AAD5U2R3_9FUNG|nr:hypothetical protein HK099_002588 [Clydaea vesicula]KAJ3384303.1 hypothetical protein HDU92_003647 [Lobulomyces angularis]